MMTAKKYSAALLALSLTLGGGATYAATENAPNQNIQNTDQHSYVKLATTNTYLSHHG
ncbi:hypothetical protein SAMN04488542_1312 [Fontibacillus panacisegetis]|uniref:Uncharacterized protein n=1 Tax=Fontibacillus panacisegetis TaxID=670482 RepID=A0A1G7SM87_9BACL|nr:hypothetical protein [Fontibacillus panacisegetis]SDG24175.1 hypothetical protein SAMN04488542_1312 [Fontibacillus panacisegetis]